MHNKGQDQKGELRFMAVKRFLGFLVLTVISILILPQVVLAENSSDDIQDDTSSNIAQKQEVVEKTTHVGIVNKESDKGEGDFFDLFGGIATPLGSDDPMIKGTIASMFAVTGLGVIMALTNSAIRKKMVDQTKLKRIMKETRGWQKERMAAMRAKDQAKINELSKKSSYMNKMSMEMMQMNMRPMMITMVPILLIFYLVLPALFSYTVGISPVSLNVMPGEFFQLTCTAEQAADPDHICTQENELFLWAWYMLSSITFSGIIMKITKTQMDLNS